MRTYTTKNVKEKDRRILSVFIVFTIIALLLTFKKPAELLAKGLQSVGVNVTGEQIQNTAKGLFWVGLGVSIIRIAPAFAGVPFVGVAILVVGVAVTAIGALMLFRKKKVEIENTSLDDFDNTNIGGDTNLGGVINM